MVYVYCRKPNNSDKESPISIIQKWVNDNNVNIDEIVFDDEVKQKDSVENRKLGLYIIPKLKDGDILLATEVSCLARSAKELDKLFNFILSDKKVRVVCLSMNIDINMGSLSLKAAAELKSISFAAKLQEQLAHEYTKAALTSKIKQGVKMGAASAKYQARKALKSEQELRIINAKRGYQKNLNHYESKDVQTLFKIMRTVYGSKICKGEPLSWSWNLINTKGGEAERIIKMMQSFHEQDPELFKKWDFSSPLLLKRFRAHFQAIRNSVEKLKNGIGEVIEMKDDNKNVSNVSITEIEKKHAQELLSEISDNIKDTALLEDNSNDTTSNILDEGTNNGSDMISKFESENKSIKISADSISKFKSKK